MLGKKEATHISMTSLNNTFLFRFKTVQNQNSYAASPLEISFADGACSGVLYVFIRFMRFRINLT
jgi:hypothetical protein